MFFLMSLMEGKWVVLMIEQNTPDGLLMYYQYINQTAPAPVALTFYFGHNYLAFDDNDWPYLSDTVVGNVPS